MIFVLSTYAIALIVISALVALAEWRFPWRKEQKPLRKGLVSDVLHLIFNGHFLGLIFFGIAAQYLLPPLDRFVAQMGWTTLLYRNAAAGWPMAVQILVALFVIDFVQWCTHNLLHRVPWFWQFHQCHHSVVDGEMDWIVSFRFQWTEVVVYRVIGYLPLAFFGFAPTALLVHAIFGTLIGHLNHANLRLDYGWGRYILNSPRMHLWHHAYDGDPKTTVNFGIIFSLWDWLFGTAKMPDDPPPRIGFPGVEDFPKDFFGQEAWPLQKFLPQTFGARVFGSLVGAGLLALGLVYGVPSSSRSAPRTPKPGDKAAASQPSSVLPLPASAYFQTPQKATQALAAFGSEARKTGFHLPEARSRVAKVTNALGSPKRQPRP